MTKPDSPKNETLRLQALKDYNILDSLPEQAYEDIATIAAQICETPIALISLVDDKRQWIKAKEGLPSEVTELPREYSCCTYTIQQPNAIFEIKNAEEDQLFANNPLCTDKPYIKYYAGAALVNDEGYALGTICVIDHKPNELNEAQRKSLQALSRQVMALLELRKEAYNFETNKTRLERLVDNISDIAYELDEAGKFIFANPYLIKITGYSKEEILQKYYYDLVRQDYMESLGQFYYEQIKSGKDDSYYEFPIVNKAGETIWLGQTVKIFYNGDKVERVGAFAKNITELKKAREDLRESESLFRLLSENSGNLVCLQTTSGVFEYASPSIEDLTGYKQDEFVNKTHIDLAHPEDLQLINEAFTKVLKGANQNIEYRIKHKNGHTIWVETVARPIQNSDGQTTSVQTSTRNISERKKNERRRRKEQANLKALIENSTDIVWSLDKNYQYITFNSLFKNFVIQQSGKAPEVGKKALFESLPEKTAEYWKNLYTKAFEGERFIKEIQAIRDPNIYYECSFNPIVDEHEEVIGVSVFARDISNKVKVRLKKERFQKGLELLNDLSSVTKLDYSELIDKAIKEVCILFDMDSAILAKVSGSKCIIKHFYNESNPSQISTGEERLLHDSFCSVTYSTQEVFSIDSVGTSEYSSHEHYKQTQLEAYIGTPIRIGMVRYGTLSLCSQVRRVAPFDKYDEEFFELFGRWIGALLERKKYEQLILESKERAENASKAKEQFLSTMSHEIRTPLNAIIGMTHILLQENPRPEQKENLNILKFSGENLLVLLNDVLDINKIESGKLFLEQSDFNLKELLDSIKNALAYSMGEKGIECQIDYDAHLPEVIMGDAMRIAQILNNLLSNAIKFTDSGSITITARNNGIENNHALVYIEVKDTGIGMSEEECSRIFERFTQAKTSTAREYGGSGLGLTIIKGLLELMGSTVQVESTPGEGSKFFFELKLPLSDRLDAHSGPVGMPKLDRIAIRNISLLLVEDNKVNQMVSSKFLHRWGITVTLADNGEEALKLFDERHFDIILMDLQMPIMDGYKATKLIREKDKDIPILALTASVRIGQKNRAMSAGMNDFLIKPLTPHDLYLKLSKYITKEHIIELPEEENQDTIENFNQKGFNALRDLLQGDDEFKNEVIPLYISNIQSIKNKLPLTISNLDPEAADKLRHKMQTTLHTLEAIEIRQLIDKGIELIDQTPNEIDIQEFTKKLNKECDDIEKRLKDFLG